MLDRLDLSPAAENGANSRPQIIAIGPLQGRAKGEYTVPVGLDDSAVDAVHGGPAHQPKRRQPRLFDIIHGIICFPGLWFAKDLC